MKDFCNCNALHIVDTAGSCYTAVTVLCSLLG
jgi:hypothetical protein